MRKTLIFMSLATTALVVVILVTRFGIAAGRSARGPVVPSKHRPGEAERAIRDAIDLLKRQRFGDSFAIHTRLIAAEDDPRMTVARALDAAQITPPERVAHLARDLAYVEGLGHTGVGIPGYHGVIEAIEPDGTARVCVGPWIVTDQWQDVAVLDAFHEWWDASGPVPRFLRGEVPDHALVELHSGSPWPPWGNHPAPDAAHRWWMNYVRGEDDLPEL
jgi:hypothetical protein